MAPTKFARALPLVPPPHQPPQVLLRASGFYQFLEAWEAKAARGDKAGAGGGDEDDEDDDDEGGAAAAGRRRMRRRLENIQELSQLAARPGLYQAGPPELGDPKVLYDSEAAGGGGGPWGAEAAAGVVRGNEAGGGGAPVGVPVGVDALRQFADYSRLVAGDEGEDERPKVRGLGGLSS